MLNKYGLKMKGLRTACTESRRVAACRGRLWIEISYDAEADCVRSVVYASENDFTKWNSDKTFCVAKTCIALTQQQIADRINNELWYQREAERNE